MRLLQSTILLLFIFGCAKEREVEFNQGQGGADLLALSEWQGKTFTQQTSSEAIGGVNTLAGASRVNIETAEGSTQENFDIFELQNPHELLDGVSIRGRAGETYQMQYEITKDFLIINKLVPEAQIPQVERLHAREITSGPQSGLFRIPLVKFPASLVKVQSVLNANNEATNRLGEYPARDLSEATHFRFNAENRTAFANVTRRDVFNKSFFEGDWFYAVTIVSTDPERASYVGRDISRDFGFSSVSRVSFTRTPEMLRVVNRNIDPAVDTTDIANYESAIDIPVEWIDYKVEDQGNLAGIVQREVGEDDADYRQWNQRDFVKLQFQNIAFPYDKSIDTRGQVEYEDFHLAENYFSFKLYYPGQNMRLRFAFRKAHEPKQGTVFKLDDWDLFGFFKTFRNVIPGDDTHVTEEDYERNIFLNRFYPEVNPETGTRDIIFHLSHRTPDEYRELSQQAVDMWDQAFRQAQTDIRVKLHPERKVHLGDIRYNIINFVDTRNNSGLLGYGPSIADTFSGELVSATSNMYVNPYRVRAYRYIRNYIRHQAGLFDNDELDTSGAPSATPNTGNYVELTFRGAEQQAHMQRSLALSFSNSIPTELQQSLGNRQTKFNNFSEAFNFVRNTNNRYGATPESSRSLPPSISPFPVIDTDLPSFESLFGNQNQSSELLSSINSHLQDGDFFDQVLLTREKTADQYRQFSHDNFRNYSEPFNFNTGNCSYNDTQGDMIDNIRRFCGDDIQNYLTTFDLEEIKATKNYGALWTERLDPILEECSGLIIKKMMLPTLLHEMGHNFGLSHNFMASTDPLNFHFQDEAREQPIARSSSVMDYASLVVDQLEELGKYDVAAIRFGYGNKVALAPNREVVALNDLNKSIQENIDTSHPNREMFPFKFCDDYDTGFWATSPLCNRGDTGEDPLILTRRLIAEYNSYVNTELNRLDRVEGQRNIDVWWRVAAIYFPRLKKIYDEWRYMLKDLNGRENSYLPDTIAGYNAMIETIEARDDYEEKFKAYHLASEEIFNFFLDFTLKPARYCIFRNNSTRLAEIEDFEKLRNGFHGRYGRTVTSCNDQELIDYFEVKLQEASGLPKPELSFYKELGEFHNQARNNLTQSHRNYHTVDTAGMRLAKYWAVLTLTGRYPYMLKFYNTADGYFFNPGFMDNPKFRTALINRVKARVIHGQSLKSLGLNIDEIIELGFISREDLEEAETPLDQADVMMPFFDREESHLRTLWLSMAWGSLIPGETTRNHEVYRKFAPGRTDNPQIEEVEGVVTLRFLDRYWMFAHPEQNPHAFELIAKHNEIKDKQEKIELFLDNRFTIDTNQLDSIFRGEEVVTEESLANMTLNDLMEMINTKFARLDSTFPVHTLNYLLEHFIGPEFTLFQTVTQGGQITRAEAMEGNALDLLREKGIDHTQILQSRYQTRYQELQAQLQKDESEARTFKSFRREYSAQLDAIIDILSRL